MFFQPTELRGPSLFPAPDESATLDGLSRSRSDTLLFEPSRSLRYGAHYLRQLLDRFDGSIPVALTAYNAGAGKVRKDWRDILARGGWALYCEMAANADTQDYVRRILGFRQAYRDLHPTGREDPCAGSLCYRSGPDGPIPQAEAASRSSPAPARAPQRVRS